MRKVVCFLYLVAVIVVPGCTASPTQPLATENVIQITALEGYTKPLIASWELGPSPMMMEGDVSIAILGVQLSASDTKLYYSLVGMDTTQFIKENTIEIIDDNGRVIDLMSVVTLSGDEKLNLGFMSFGTRPSGASELFLQIRGLQGEAKIQKLSLCKFTGSPSEDRSDLTYSIRRDGGVEQANYKIEMNLWLTPADKPLPDPLKPQETAGSSLGITPTPIQISGMPWAEIPQGTRVIDEISFRAEDDTTNEVNDINVLLLSNGSAVTQNSGYIVIPTPIQVASPTPTLVPYP